jgi:hypothetical protein
MRNTQRGISLMGLILWSVVLVLAALLAMRLLPSYIEYFTIKKAIVGIANESRGRGVSPNEVRRAFENRSAVDDIRSVNAKDLEIVKEGNNVAITAAYRREVPLFANIGVYIDFVASSD